MKVIIIIRKKNENKARLMFKLVNKKAIEEVKRLINVGKCSKAISKVIASGKFIEELTEKEIAHEASDLILTDTNVCWNLL